MPNKIIDTANLQKLFNLLIHNKYQLIGPKVCDNAITYETIKAIEDLPVGRGDEQEKGYYRLTQRSNKALFEYNAGPHSWKQFLHPPKLPLWQTIESSFPKYAFVGVRACDLSAIAIQDRVFLQGPYIDLNYKKLRESVFVLAVNCTRAGKTCFCASMKTGPKAMSGYDLALTEILTPEEHYFIVETGSSLGAEMLNRLDSKEADEKETYMVQELLEKCSAQMGRALDTSKIKETLSRSLEHAAWDNVANRCLACANCTLVCPTCFCTTIEDVTDLTGQKAERWRKWDSCFTSDFSYLHGGSIRTSIKSRYRQWLTHKFSTWFDQFGTSGCVGCGRCITWCPAAIDVTEEIKAICSTGTIDEKESRHAKY